MVPNEKLAAARVSAGYSRAELAHVLAVQLGYTDREMCHWLARLEAGRIKRPTEPRREVLRDVLKVTSDADLGFDRRSRVTVEPTGETVSPGDDMATRRALLGGGGLSALALLSFGPHPDLKRLTEATNTPEPPPSRVGAPEVAAVGLAVQWANRSDNAVGGGLARASVRGQLTWACGLLGAKTTDEIRPRLYEQVARLAEVCGWMHHDAGQQVAARDQLNLALSLANEAGDVPDLRALILTDLARQAVTLSKAGDALDLTGFARVRERELSPSMRGMVYGVEARGYALAANEKATRRAIGLAEESYLDEDDYPDDWPPTSGEESYPVDAQLWGDTGGALEVFALNGKHVEEYVRRLLDGAQTYPEGYVRSRAFCFLEAARVQALHGDPAEAISTGARGLSVAASLRSARVNDRLNNLSAALAPHSQAAEFRAELHAAVAS